MRPHRSASIHGTYVPLTGHSVMATQEPSASSRPVEAVSVPATGHSPHYLHSAALPYQNGPSPSAFKSPWGSSHVPHEAYIQYASAPRLPAFNNGGNAMAAAGFANYPPPYWTPYGFPTLPNTQQQNRQASSSQQALTDQKPHPSYGQHSAAATKREKEAAPSLSAAESAAAVSACAQQPTYWGFIKTTQDAISLLCATDLADSTPNQPPRRITRRLLESERAALIRSGTVFAWDEKEADMRRWTDGRCWSASRVSGCFLTYRELQVRKHRSGNPGGPTANQYKLDGLIKQSFSMTTTTGRKMHIISYYTKRDARENLLRRVVDDARFTTPASQHGWGVRVDEEEYPDPALQQLEGDGSTGAVDDEDDDAAESRPTVRRASPASPKTFADIRSDSTPATILSEAKDIKGDSAVAYNATPLSEARGLLAIDPIPVEPARLERFFAPSLPHERRSTSGSSNGGLVPAQMAVSPPSVLPRKRGASITLAPVMPSPKRTRQVSDGSDPEDGGGSSSSGNSSSGNSSSGMVPNLIHLPPPQRPRLHRLRSSSFSDMRGTSFRSTSSSALTPLLTPGGSTSSSSSSAALGDPLDLTEERSLEPVTPEGVGPTKKGGPNVASCNAEQENAVGALLSLSGGANPSSQASPTLLSSAFPSSSLGSYKSADSAALSRFKIRL